MINNNNEKIIAINNNITKTNILYLYKNGCR